MTTSALARRQPCRSPRATLPGPSRRITVEPIRVPATAPAVPDRPGPEVPAPEETPRHEPVPAR
ncbi:MAG TPA: hypothetical protein VMF14_14710 [Solirubrobacteraceae bacterium]|nr:hypothetical protein [Solirubrobacteraceae bacterium]